MKVRSGLPWVLVGGLFILLSFAMSVLAEGKKLSTDGKIMRKKPVLLSLPTAPSQVITIQPTFSIEITGKEAYGFESMLKGELQSIVQNEKKGIRLVEKDASLRITLSINTAEYEQQSKGSNIFGKLATRSEEVSFRGNGFIRVEDWTAGTSVQIYKDSLEWNYNRSFNGQLQTVILGPLSSTGGAPTPDKLKEAYMSFVIEKVKRGLGRGVVKFEVPLAETENGELEAGITAARSGNWQEALDKWKAVPVFPSPKADSYRLYNLGLAYEALGLKLMEVEELDKALAQFTQAQECYSQARAKNPTEKNFTASNSSEGSILERIPLHQKECTQWKEYKIAKAAMDAAEDAMTEEATAKAKAEQPVELQLSQDGILRNVDILVLVKRKTSPDFIRRSIEQSVRTQFDLSLQEQIKLMDSGVPESIIETMKAHNNKPRPQPEPEPTRPGGRRKKTGRDSGN